jgi:hypothetical protein
LFKAGQRKRDAARAAFTFASQARSDLSILRALTARPGRLGRIDCVATEATAVWVTCIDLEDARCTPAQGAVHWEGGFLPGVVRLLVRRKDADDGRRRDARNCEIGEASWVVVAKEDVVAKE